MRKSLYTNRERTRQIEKQTDRQTETIIEQGEVFQDICFIVFQWVVLPVHPSAAQLYFRAAGFGRR